MIKKQLLLTAILLYAIVVFSQKVTINNGVYTTYDRDEKVNLIIKDGKFHISVYSGDVEIKNDSIFLNDARAKEGGFSLKKSFNEKIKSNKIRVTLKEKYLSESATTFIGTQNGNSTPNYRSISSIYQEMNVEKNEKSDFIFEIDKSDFLLLAAEDKYYRKTEIATFKLPTNTNDIEVVYVKNTLKDVNLSGTYNQKTKEVTISNKGIDPLIFKINEENTELKNESILPLETSIKKDWTFPGKETDTNLPTEEVTLSPIDTIIPKLFVFSHYKSKSLKESLSHIARKPKKFLVVSIDLKNKNRQVVFDDYIKKSEGLFNEYYAYDDVMDQFDYYLATEKDKNLLSKYKIKSESEILILNATGDLIYHTAGSLSDKANLFDTYNSACEDFEKANQQLEFDKAMFNKNASTKQILAVLKRKYSFSGYKEETTETAKFTPPVIAPNSMQDEAMDTISEKKMTDEERKELSKTFPPPMVPKENQQVVEESYNYQYYTIIKDQENIYKLKSTLETVTEKWEKIVAEFEKSKKIDNDFVTVLKQELNNEGFTKNIFGRSSFKILDFKMLNYVFGNYKILSQKVAPQIETKETEVDKTATEKVADALVDAYSEDDYATGINTVLENYFYRVAYDSYDTNQKSTEKLIFDNYKKYLEIVDYKPSVVKRYMNVLAGKLDNTAFKKEYFDMFDIYFTKIMSPNKSIIENLDIDFSNNPNNEGDWSSYKSYFATDCNQTAWEIVKFATNKSLILKGIKWSKASIELEKKSHYFWDTLARLYYLDGQKEKAFEAQQNAIDFSENSGNTNEYRSVLRDMKNGTYTFSDNN
jgi:hypothetical protein